MDVISMSTRHEVYLMFGTKLDIKRYEKALDQDIDLYGTTSLPWCGKDSVGNCGILSDVMSGLYCVAGIVLAVQAEDGDPDIGLLNLDEVLQDRMALDFKVQHWLETNKILDLVAEDVPRFNLHLVSHWH